MFKLDSFCFSHFLIFLSFKNILDYLKIPIITPKIMFQFIKHFKYFISKSREVYWEVSAKFTVFAFGKFFFAAAFLAASACQSCSF